MQKKFTVFTDGGSRGNPGVAGAGAVIADSEGKIIKRLSKALGKQTNNFAEYHAVILGLEGLKKIIPKEERGTAEVEVKMDSQLVARQLSGIYEIKESTLFPLYMHIHNLEVSHFKNIRFTHIPREQNGEADTMANIAMDEQDRGMVPTQLSL